MKHASGLVRNATAWAIYSTRPTRPTEVGKDLLETLAGKEHPMGPVARPGPGNVLRLAGAGAVGLARGPAVELAAQYRWVLAHTGPPEEGRGRVATC